MPKLKTHQATAKRFKIGKSGVLLKKHTGQDHFNAREKGNVTRAKRRLNRVHKTDIRNIRELLPYS